MTMRRPKAPPFKQRLEVAVAAGKAASATRVKVNPDGSVELDFRPDDAKSPLANGDAEPNDFDLIIERRRGKAREEKS
jgi:hypothetical protein